MVGVALRDVFDTVVLPGASGKPTAQGDVQHLRQRGGSNGIEILEVVPDAVIAAP